MKKKIQILASLILTILFVVPLAQASIWQVFNSGGRNGYVLDRAFSDNGYDWWWHCFTAVSRSTGNERPFFIEYFIINPALGGSYPILGQLPANKNNGIKPSYVMVMAGTWGDGAVQIKNYYGISQLTASTLEENVKIGTNYATETHLKGSVSLTQTQVTQHPEYMSNAGSISWDLSVVKPLSYNVGYAGSALFQDLELFDMFWHVQGILSKYSGTITFNGEVYDVIADHSWGYQDKNFGKDFTNPWVWLFCDDFTSTKTGLRMNNTTLDIGGGNPKIAGISLGDKALMAFYVEGKLYEFNFTKLLDTEHLDWTVTETTTDIKWHVEAVNWDYQFIIDFANPKSKMLKVKYENPQGQVNHQNLWNGGHATGTVKMYKRRWIIYGISWAWDLVDTFNGKHGAGEYGKY